MTGKRIFGAFAIGIALFFFWPVVIGGWQKVGALKAAVAERDALLTDRTRIIANAKTAYTEYQQKLGQADGQKFVALVPVRKDTAEIVSAAQAIATESGVQLNEFTVGDSAGAENEQFKKLSFTMGLSGSYTSMRQFLASLEQYVRLINVDSIEAAVDSQDPSKIRFTIRADAYFIK